MLEWLNQSQDLAYSRHLGSRCYCFCEAPNWGFKNDTNLARPLQIEIFIFVCNKGEVITMENVKFSTKYSLFFNNQAFIISRTKSEQRLLLKSRLCLQKNQLLSKLVKLG